MGATSADIADMPARFKEEIRAAPPCILPGRSRLPPRWRFVGCGASQTLGTRKGDVWTPRAIRSVTLGYRTLPYLGNVGALALPHIGDSGCNHSALIVVQMTTR